MRGSCRSERRSKSLTHFEGIYSRVTMILSSKDGFCEDQDVSIDVERGKMIFLEIQVVLYMFPCVAPCLNHRSFQWHLSGTLFLLEHPSLMMHHSFPQVPHMYYCVRMTGPCATHVQHHVESSQWCRVDPVPQTSRSGPLTLMVHHHAWSPGRMTGLTMNMETWWGDWPDIKSCGAAQTGHSYPGVNSEKCGQWQT